MAGGLVEADLAYVRCEDLGVALLGEFAADEVLQFLADDRTLWRPEDQSLADCVVDVEESEVLADTAVITLLGLLEQGEVVIEFLLGGKGGAVDALKLGIILITEVEGTGDMG